MQVSQPICLINNLAELCLVKKIPPVTNTTVHTFQDGWLKLPEELRHFTPTWKLQSSPFVCCYQDVFPLTAPITGWHTRQVCPPVRDAIIEAIYSDDPLFGSILTFAIQPPPQLFYDTFDIERKACRVIVSDLSCFNFPLPLLCPSLPLFLNSVSNCLVTH